METETKTTTKDPHANLGDSIEQKHFARAEVWLQVERVATLTQFALETPSPERVAANEAFTQLHGVLREYLTLDEELDITLNPALLPFMTKGQPKMENGRDAYKAARGKIEKLLEELDQWASSAGLR